MASKPGERRLQILQTLAAMLETPRNERITTAALASRLDVSEAALYRHFASKAQMFEGPDRIHRDDAVLAGQPHHGGVHRRRRAGDADGGRAARLRGKESRHDPRADRRRAGQRGRATAGAHEPALRSHRGRAAAVAEDRAGGRRLARRSDRRGQRPAGVRLGRWTLFAKSRLQAPAAGWLGRSQRKFLFGPEPAGPARAARRAGRGCETLYAACTVEGAIWQPEMRQRPSACFSIAYKATRTVLSVSTSRSGCTTMPSMTAPSRNST